MKNRGALVLIEQVIMLLVFALAAVLCLRAFVWADAASKEMAARDQAVIQAQNAVEVLKSCAGDGAKAVRLYGGVWDGQTWTLHFDEQWQQSAEECQYLLVAEPVRKTPYLGTAEIRVFREETCLARLDTAWQEVSPRE